MADEGKDQSKEQPALDVTKLAEALKPSIEQTVKTALEASAKEPVTEEPTKESTLRKVLLDELGGDLAGATLAAADAKDLARFYALHPEAKEFAGDVEKKFDELMKAGRPTDRESIWKWYRGENFDKFFERAKAVEAQKLEDAQNQANPLGVTIGKGTRVVDPYAQTPEDLDKSLQGVSF